MRGPSEPIRWDGTPRASRRAVIQLKHDTLLQSYCTGILTHISLFMHEYSIHVCNLEEILFQTPWASKMNQILSCDRPSKPVRWSYLAHLGLHVHIVFPRKMSMKTIIIIIPLPTKLVWSRWLDIGYALFFASLSTFTLSRLINLPKKNLANIQPSWPHAWSITIFIMTHMALNAISLENHKNKSPLLALYISEW